MNKDKSLAEHVREKCVSIETLIGLAKRTGFGFGIDAAMAVIRNNADDLAGQVFSNILHDMMALKLPKEESK